MASDLPLSWTDKFDRLLHIMNSKRFLKNLGLGKEVPFFICPYPQEEAEDMANVSRQLVNRLSVAGINVLEINLYDLSITLLQERGIWTQILEVETSLPKDQLQELLQGVLDPEQHLVPAIAARMKAASFDILFLDGVAEVFPYIRSHNILNNLQRVAKERPTVIFFPGDYTHTVENGATLKLFNRLPDDKYYRAFNIYKYEV